MIHAGDRKDSKRPQRNLTNKQVALFSHLSQWQKESSDDQKANLSRQELHPDIIRVGQQIASGTIIGSSARAVAMLTAIKSFITAYKTPVNQALSRDMDLKLKPVVRYLDECRQKSVSMTNAINYLKKCVVKIPPTMSEPQAKQKLLQDIDLFINDRILIAGTAIVIEGQKRISNGDVILTYSMSSVVERTLIAAHTGGKRFRVVVVDARPKLEGKVLLSRLVAAGLQCSYILLPAIGHVISEVTKVFLGAHSVLANGATVARTGSALVGVMAQEFHVPVLVFCETYKFDDAVQLNSFSSNELGNPDDLVATGRGEPRLDYLVDWRDMRQLKLLNLAYDVMPVEFVKLVVSEYGQVPPTSISAMIREYHKTQT
jgi:translation initiation factor eIF-2B subunit delta